MRSLILLIAILVPACWGLEAAEPESRLPVTNSWIRYRNVTDLPCEGTQTLRWFAGPLENRQPTRWLEVETISETPFKGRYIEKLRLPEKSLRESQAPLQDCLRSWVKHDDNPVERLDRLLGTADISYGPLLSGLRQPSAEWKSQPIPRRVDCQRGRLDIPAAMVGKHHAGNVFQTDKGETIRRQWTTECTVWPHPDLPGVFAAAKFVQSVVDTRDGKTAPPSFATHELVVQDWGDKAESAIPDAN
jgi:hypothetical protein